MSENIVEKIARLIDAEGAYAVMYDGTGPEAQQHPTTVRQKYFQAKYECQAIDILKLVLRSTPEQIKEALVEFEKDGWRRLGIDIDRADFAQTADGIIRKKYGAVQS